MATWHPPIPAGRLYSSDALDLGPALAMLVWCYDNIERDGRIEVQLNKLAVEFGKSYRTIKDWWAALRAGPFFCEQIDRGKRGWIVRMSEDWVDWHVMANNYPSRPAQGQDTSLDDKGEVQNIALEAGQVPVKSRSRPDEVQNAALETSAYKEDQHDQNPTSSSSPIESSSGDVDEFVKNLLREFPISRTTARKIALTGADFETVARSLMNNGDPRDPRSYGKILDRILGAPPEKGKPYSGPYAKPPTQNGSAPRPPKADTLPSGKLAELAKDITL